jgi:HAE1 family hydrophobic/amphiphilic exporter-1
MLPTGATLEQTQKVVDEVQRHFQENEKEAVESCMTITGFGFSGRTQTNGMVFIKLKDWDLRNRSIFIRLKDWILGNRVDDLGVKAVAQRATKTFSRFRNSLVFAFPPPAVVELGIATGFDFQLLDRGGLGHEKLMAARNQLLGMAFKDARLTKVQPNGLEDMPEYRVDVD